MENNLPPVSSPVHLFLNIQSGNLALASAALQLIAAACVFIASKVDESPRSLRDFAYVYIKNKNPKGAEALQRISSNMVSFQSAACALYNGRVLS
jgi:hypothetical protein